MHAAAPVHLRGEIAVGVVAEQGWLPEEHSPDDLVGGVVGEPLQLGGQVVLGAEREERRKPALAAKPILLRGMLYTEGTQTGGGRKTCCEEQNRTKRGNRTRTSCLSGMYQKAIPKNESNSTPTKRRGTPAEPPPNPLHRSSRPSPNPPRLRIMSKIMSWSICRASASQRILGMRLPSMLLRSTPGLAYTTLAACCRVKPRVPCSHSTCEATR